MRGDGLIFLALLFLINPSVQVVDIFPDFIAYFIIIKRLSYAIDRAPYFAEARVAFSRLMLLSILKIPAYFVIVTARSGNVGDTDIYALFAFSFAAIEAILSVMAIYYLFEAIFYLGQRTDATVLIRPYYVNRRKTRTRSPEALRRLLFTFAIYKCAAYGLPELLLLTKTVTEEELKNYFNITKLYPYTIIIAVFSVIVFGIIVMKRAYAYYKHTINECSLKESLDSLVGEDARARLEISARVKDMSMILGIIIFASIFTLELRVDNLSLLNIIPHFLMGFILIFAVHKLKKHITGCIAPMISLAVFIALSIAAWIMEAAFLSEYSFSLLASSGAVKREFQPALFISLLEMLAFCLSMILIGHLLVRLQRTHTEWQGSPELEYSNERRRRKKLLYTAGYSALGVTVGILRYINLLLRYFAKNTTVNIENDGMITSGVVTEPLLPWFGVVVGAVSIIFIFYSYYLLSSIKEDIEIKYS